MIEESKMKELKERIDEQKRNLSRLKEERKHCADPAKMVSLDKKIADASGILFALERTKNAVSYQAPQPTEKQILLAGVNRYLQEKRENIQNVEMVIKQAETELQEVENVLEKATSAGEVDLVVRYSIKRNDLQKKLEYIRPMKKAAEEKQPFPKDAIMKEWKKICEEKQADFEMLLTRIGVLAEEYRNACDELLEMNNILLSVRNDMRHIAEENGINISFYPILTAEVDTKPLVISKVDGLKPSFITGGLYGTAL